MSGLVLDIPRLYTGIAEWMAYMIFAVQFRPRLPLKSFVLVSIGGLAIQCIFLMVTDNVHITLWIPCMIVAALLMMGVIMLLCDVSMLTSAYTTIRAFILAEFTASIQWQVHCFLWPENDPVWWQQYGLLLSIFGAVFFIMWLLERRCNPENSHFAATRLEFWTVAVIGVTIFAISNLSFYSKGTPFSSQYASEIMNIRTLVDLGGTAILFAYHLQCQQALARKELDAMQTILENQYAQYRMSRDSIDMINRKYHDLKHQIAALRAEPDATVRSRWLDEMEADIRSYEAQNKTGNTVLDTVLTGKSLYCQKHGVELSVVADGKSLEFMDVMDICTIVGNALDNAIECELKIPDKSKRMIHLNLSTQKQFLMLRVENYCPEAPVFQSGFPITTKTDASNHGFGLKSIQYTAQKYGGTITTCAEDGWFVLKVLIPLSAKIESLQ